MKKEISIISHAYQADTTKPPKKPLFLKRQLVVFFCFSACFIMFLLRYNLSVAVVAIKEEMIPCSIDVSFRIFHGNYSSWENQTQQDDVACFEKKYKYDEVMISQFLAAYFYGYAFWQFPAGRLSENYGIAKHLIGYGLLGSGICSILTPFMLDLGPIFLIITRFLVGSFHAAILCCSYCLFADWLPIEKNGSAITWANIGFELGGTVCFFLTGQICNMESLGWRYSFYLFGLTSFIWFIPYHFMIYSRPEDDPNLSEYEKNLIKQEKKAKQIQSNDESLSKDFVKVAPELNFKTLITSGPVFASSCSKFSYGLGYYIITTKIPDYLKEVFNMPIDQNGLWSASPLLGIFISKMACLKLSKWLINSNLMSLTNVRKFFQSISLFTPAVCLSILTLKNDNRDLDILLIFLAMLGQGQVCGGDSPITSEFGGELSGSIFGFTNSLACVNGFLAPLMVGLILESVNDKFIAWNLVFYIAIVVYVIGGLIFLVFASAEPQEWAQPTYIKDEKNESPA